MDRTQQNWGRLVGMMLLIYAVQGAWWPVLSVHLQDLGINGRGRGWIFATLALASTLTPLGAGQLADRLMPIQRLLGVIYALGAGLLALVASGVVDGVIALFAVFLGYWLITAPGYGLATTLALRNLSDPLGQFARVRLWGTVGWMAAGWLTALALAADFRWSGVQGTHGAFALASLLSFLFAIYCFTKLPHTPPVLNARPSTSDLAEAAILLTRRPVALFLIVAFAVSLSTPFVYQAIPSYMRRCGLSRPWVPAAMSLSQITEVAGLAVLPFMHRRIGLRGTITLGLAAWVIMYATLASGASLALTVLIQPLNGIAIAGYLITGQMFLDTQAPPDRRASVQALYVVISAGIGSFLGNLLAGEIVSFNGGVSPGVFIVPGLINLAACLLVAACFRNATPSAASVASSLDTGPHSSGNRGRLAAGSSSV